MVRSYRVVRVVEARGTRISRQEEIAEEKPNNLCTDFPQVVD